MGVARVGLCDMRLPPGRAAGLTYCPRAPCSPPAVPLPERPEALRGLLYEAVVAALVPHASYPPSFTCWEEEFEVDEDGFARLRWVRVSSLLQQLAGA